MKKSFLLALSICLFSNSVFAEPIKSKIVTSNGVAINLYSDDFAERYEYDFPSVAFSVSPIPSYLHGITNAAALIVVVKNGKATAGISLSGYAFYEGDWKMFNSAVFKGGAPANFVSEDRDVSCKGGCTYNESFRIDLTLEQIKKYSENGDLQIQISARSGDTSIITVPANYIDALSEVLANPLNK